MCVSVGVYDKIAEPIEPCHVSQALNRDISRLDHSKCRGKRRRQQVASPRLAPGKVDFGLNYEEAVCVGLESEIHSLEPRRLWRGVTTLTARPTPSSPIGLVRAP